jgi:hypothetical protein
MTIGDIIDKLSKHAQCEIGYLSKDNTVVPHCFRYEGYTSDYTEEFKYLDKCIPVERLTTRNHIIMILVKEEELFGS